jgi:hypothetical protein
MLGILASFASACGSAAADGQSACDQAIAQAVAIDPGSDTVTSADGAIAGCPSLEAWVSAAEKYPDAFGGRDPAAVASERCDASVQLATSPVCTDLR